MDRYLLKAHHQPGWTEVTKADWIQAERSAGFRPKMARDDPRYMDTCATAGFDNGQISGRIEVVGT